MLTKRLLSAWFYVKLDSTSHGRKWHPIVIKATNNMPSSGECSRLIGPSDLMVVAVAAV